MARKTKSLGDHITAGPVVPIVEPEYYFDMGSTGRASYTAKEDACWAARRRAYTSTTDVVVMRSRGDGPDVEVERFRRGVVE